MKGKRWSKVKSKVSGWFGKRKEKAIVSQPPINIPSKQKPITILTQKKNVPSTHFPDVSEKQVAQVALVSQLTPTIPKNSKGVNFMYTPNGTRDYIAEDMKRLGINIPTKKVTNTSGVVKPKTIADILAQKLPTSSEIEAHMKTVGEKWQSGVNH